MIYLDACLLIYLVEPHALFRAPLKEAIGAAQGERLAISPLVRLECLVGPIKRADVVMQRRYDAFFQQYRILGLPDAVYDEAAVLRAFRPADARRAASRLRTAPPVQRTLDERGPLAARRARTGAQRAVLTPRFDFRTMTKGTRQRTIPG